MLRRTKGRLLITLLVITGLAGTLNTSSISKKERKSAVSIMKSTRAEVIKTVKGLSDKQLNYKPSPDRWSIKENIYHLAISERNLWSLMESTLDAPANPDKRSEIRITDDELLTIIENRGNKVKTAESFEPKNSPYRSLQEALEDYKLQRLDHIKYMKSTTEDLRNHVAQLPFGWIDCYQLSLMIAAHNIRHKQQIDEIKAEPGYPKQ